MPFGLRRQVVLVEHERSAGVRGRVIAQPRVVTIPMSFNPAHIRENFAAAEIKLTAEEIEQLNHD